jgi:hypothetical protein
MTAMKILNHEAREGHEESQADEGWAARLAASLGFFVIFVSFVVRALVWN